MEVYCSGLMIYFTNISHILFSSFGRRQVVFIIICYSVSLSGIYITALSGHYYTILPFNMVTTYCLVFLTYVSVAAFYVSGFFCTVHIATYLVLCLIFTALHMCYYRLYPYNAGDEWHFIPICFSLTDLFCHHKCCFDMYCISCQDAPNFEYLYSVHPTTELCITML